MKVAITHARLDAPDPLEEEICDLVSRLVDAGHEVHLFRSGWKDPVDPRAQVHKVPDAWKPVRFLNLRGYDRWVSRKVRREVFDVVHGFGMSSYQDLCTLGGACLQREAAPPQEGPVKRREPLHRRQLRSIQRRRFTPGNFHRLIAASDLAAETVRARFAVPAEQVVTLYPGVDTARFHPDNRATYAAEYRERIVIPQATFVIACLADDYERLGVDALLEVARRLNAQGGLPDGRPFRIAVIGAGDPHYERALAAHAKDLGVWQQIKFYGPQHRPERWLGMADMFVLPARFEPAGQQALEAMATGLPVVVSRRTGAAELIREGENGFLTEPADAAALVERILALAADPALGERVGAAARATAEEHTREAAFERLMTLYEGAAAAKRTVTV